MATLWRHYCQFWPIGSPRWQVWLLQSGAKNKTFLQWKQLKSKSIWTSGVATLQWNGGIRVIYLVTMRSLHWEHFTVVVILTLPIVLFHVWSSPLMLQSFRTKHYVLPGQTAFHALPHDAYRSCVHASVFITHWSLSQTHLYKVFLPLEPHTSGPTVEICYLTRIWQQNVNAETLREQCKALLVGMR